MRGTVRKYWVEIIFGFGFILGILLMMGDGNIITSVQGFFQRTWSGVDLAIADSNAFIQDFFRMVEISDLVGFLMAVVALGILVWRARNRFKESERYTGRICPRCMSSFQRIHRTLGDRILGKIFFLKFHRYRCSNPECSWEGLRLPGRRIQKIT